MVRAVPDLPSQIRRISRKTNRYNSASALAAIKAKLYGKRQREDEPVSLFIVKKRALLSQIFPEMREEDMIRDIVILMRNKIRAYVRTYTFQNMEELTRIAEEIKDYIGGPELSRRPVPPPRTADYRTNNGAAPRQPRQDNRPENPPPQPRQDNRPAPPANEVAYEESSAEKDDDDDEENERGPQDTDGDTSDEESESALTEDDEPEQAKAVTGTDRAEPFE